MKWLPIIPACGARAQPERESASLKNGLSLFYNMQQMLETSRWFVNVTREPFRSVSGLMLLCETVSVEKNEITRDGWQRVRQWHRFSEHILSCVLNPLLLSLLTPLCVCVHERALWDVLSWIRSLLQSKLCFFHPQQFICVSAQRHRDTAPPVDSTRLCQDRTTCVLYFKK